MFKNYFNKMIGRNDEYIKMDLIITLFRDSLSELKGNPRASNYKGKREAFMSSMIRYKCEGEEKEQMVKFIAKCSKEL